MPVAYPVFRQVYFECMLNARVQIELQSVLSSLNHSELCVAFRDIRSTLIHAAQLAWLHVETDGQFLAREFHVAAAIHLHPLVVSAEVQHTFLYPCVTHEVGRRVEG